MSLSWLKSTLSSFSLSSYIYSEHSSAADDVDDQDLCDTEQKTISAAVAVAVKVKGLENLGNTCFFNASVQALLACPKFVQYVTILSRAHKENTINDTGNGAGIGNKVFCELLLDLYLGNISSPKHLFLQLCAFHPTEFSSFTQSDAHESFNKMMEILDIEQLYISTEAQSENIINSMFEFLDLDINATSTMTIKAKNVDVMQAKNPFGGFLGSMVECTVCKHSNQSKQTSFTCLTLSLCDATPTPISNICNCNSVKLIDRIAAFEIEEEIEGYRCIVCEYKAITNIINAYNRNDEKKEMNEIEMMVLNEQYLEISNNKNGLNGYHHRNVNGNGNGNVLLSGKQRLKYRIDMSLNKEYRTTAKKKQFVSRYPNVLCIHLNRLQFGAKDGRYVSFNALLSLDMDMENNMNDMNNMQYILMSVIVHHGNDTHGHYTTYKRKINLKLEREREFELELQWKSLADFQSIERNSEWYHISDEFVNKVTINQVLMCKAYMLFYQKNQFSFVK